MAGRPQRFVKARRITFVIEKRIQDLIKHTYNFDETYKLSDWIRDAIDEKLERDGNATISNTGN